MTKHKHLTLDDRSVIEIMLNEKRNFKQISLAIGKDPTTVSKEIRSRLIYMRTGALSRSYNSCSKRFTCERHNLCSPCHSSRKFSLCRRCSMCNRFCDEFQKQICPKLEKPPYVCNGCSGRVQCTLEKRFYRASEAHKEYSEVFSESHSGISLSEKELAVIDGIVSPLIRKNHSPHNICANNISSLMVSERTLYRLIDSGLISAKNIDLPRKVRFRARKKPSVMKVDRACRKDRTYADYLSFMEDHPGFATTQLDSVVGKTGGKVLLTIHFPQSETMFAFIRNRNDAQSVIDIFNMLYDGLGHEKFTSIFKVCLADNGSEFTNPSAIEMNSDNERRTYMFYCNPHAPYQKGSAEYNHTFIRRFIPKGVDMSVYTQEDISLMMDNINSYTRASLGDRSPYEVFSYLYGTELLDLLGCNIIPPGEVTLSRKIFRKEHRDDSR